VPLCAEGCVGVQSARPDAIGGNGRDAIEDNQPHVGDVTIDIIGAPLRRTMALIVVAVGLDESPRGSRIVRLNADGMGAGSNGHNRHFEFRQRRRSRPRS